MPTELIRIMLIDDHLVVRESWKTLLENNPKFSVIAEHKNDVSAVNKAFACRPDIVLIDINMSSNNAIIITQTLLKELPGVKIIGLSAYNQPKYAVKMMELGASGYLTKTSSLDEINHGIMEIAAGNIYICEEVKKFLPATE